MALELCSVSLPSEVADASDFIDSSVLSKVLVIEAILATISSIAEEDSETLAAWVAILVFNCLMVWIISSIVADVSVTLEAWVNIFLFTSSIWVLISFAAPAVSDIFWASSSPIFVIAPAFLSTDWIAVLIFPIVWLKYSERLRISSKPVTGKLTVKSPSPCAISFNAAATRTIGLIIRRDNQYTTRAAISSIAIPIRYIQRFNIRTSLKNSLAGARSITTHPVFIFLPTTNWASPLYEPEPFTTSSELKTDSTSTDNEAMSLSVFAASLMDVFAVTRLKSVSPITLLLVPTIKTEPPAPTVTVLQISERYCPSISIEKKPLIRLSLSYIGIAYEIRKTSFPAWKVSDKNGVPLITVLYHGWSPQKKLLPSARMRLPSIPAIP